VYRYLELLNDIGFKVEKDVNSKIWISSNINSDVIPFTHQEIDYLYKLINSTGKHSKLKESILNKLYQSSEITITTNHLFEAHLGQLIDKISIAINEKKQIILKSYHSANSQSIRDRLVEPMCFTDNYESLSAFEVSKKKNKYFNIERISSIEILNATIQFEHLHEFYRPDVFGFQGKSLNKEIELILSLRAFLFLKEEYPMCNAYIQEIPNTNQFNFKCKVQSYKAPSRFVNGFQNEIEVKGSNGFLKYLGNQQKNK
jgi:predicted DNA-binding transcriptional regulator YafY